MSRCPYRDECRPDNVWPYKRSGDHCPVEILSFDREEDFLDTCPKYREFEEKYGNNQKSDGT